MTTNESSVVVKSALPAYVRYARYGFAAVAVVFAACIIVQVFIAGLATFVDMGDWAMHKSFVKLFSPLPFVLIALSFIGRMSWKARLLSVALFLLIVSQFLTSVFAAELSVLAALHPVIALILFWCSIHVMRLSMKERVKR